MSKTSITFLLQATKLLHKGIYGPAELNVIFNYINDIDDETIKDYTYSSTILNYTNDLELFLEIIDKVMIIFEIREEYEKCHIIKNKKIKCLKIKDEL